MRQYAEKRLQEEREMRDLVEQVSEGRKNTKQARLKLQKYKQRIGMVYRVKLAKKRWRLKAKTFQTWSFSAEGW